MKTHYLYADWKRIIKNYSLYAACIGVAASLILSLEDMGFTNNSVLSTYFFATELSGVMLAYIFCAFPYATVLCEDLENQYIRYQIIRGSLRKYVLSKVMVIYITSVITMVMGTILFLLLCRIQGPWADWQVNDYGVQLEGCYSGLIKSGHYMGYCILYSFQLGLLAAMLSVLAAFLSLFISNKVTVLIIPILIYQILLGVSGPKYFNVYIFRAYNKLFEQDWQCFLYSFFLSIIIAGGLSIGIYKKLTTRL